MNLANKLTVFRLVLVPFYLVFMLFDFTAYNRYIALGIFIIATITDKLDGSIARKYNMITSFGKFMDPIADKLLVCSALVCLTSLDEIPAWVVITIIAREFLISGIRIIAAEGGVAIAASWWGKTKTIAQMVMTIVIIADIDALFIVEQILIYLSLLLTVISAADYLIKNKNVLTFKDK
ncbi:MAG: CDP-diacylglycerol--glycerol-3-phosphate 3-phosphatidyltransferase [Clostridia bacterium]|nr:CDP-diacylglycerol--glycerol-3-phosphate 3-phosphatidyltransferase [Clostridia bacterium]